MSEKSDAKDTVEGARGADRSETAVGAVAAWKRVRRRHRLWMLASVVTVLALGILAVTVVAPWWSRRAFRDRVRRQVPRFEAALVELRSCVTGDLASGDALVDRVLHHVVRSGLPEAVLRPCMDTYRSQVQAWKSDRPAGSPGSLPMLDEFLRHGLPEFAAWPPFGSLDAGDFPDVVCRLLLTERLRLERLAEVLGVPLSGASTVSCQAPAPLGRRIPSPDLPVPHAHRERWYRHPELWRTDDGLFGVYRASPGDGQPAEEVDGLATDTILLRNRGKDAWERAVLPRHTRAFDWRGADLWWAGRVDSEDQPEETEPVWRVHRRLNGVWQEGLTLSDQGWPWKYLRIDSTGRAWLLVWHAGPGGDREKAGLSLYVAQGTTLTRFFNFPDTGLADTHLEPWRLHVSADGAVTIATVNTMDGRTWFRSWRFLPGTAPGGEPQTVRLPLPDHGLTRFCTEGARHRALVGRNSYLTSDDDGASWLRHAVDLPADFVPYAHVCTGKNLLLFGEQLKPGAIHPPPSSFAQVTCGGAGTCSALRILSPMKPSDLAAVRHGLGFRVLVRLWPLRMPLLLEGTADGAVGSVRPLTDVDFAARESIEVDGLPLVPENDSRWEY